MNIYVEREKKKYLDKKNNNKINKSNAVFMLTEYEWRSLFIFLFYFNLLFILLSGFIYHLQQPFLLFQTFHFRPIYELSDLDYMYYHIGMSISLGPGLSKCPREIMLAHICVNVTLQTWSYCVIPSYLQGIMCHISCYKPVHTHIYSRSMSTLPRRYRTSIMCGHSFKIKTFSLWRGVSKWPVGALIWKLQL